MTPERRLEVAAELGMDQIPIPRYEDLPEVTDAAWATEKYNFQKALQCVDAVASAAFMGYVERLGLPIDQAMDPRQFKRGWSQALQLDTSRPIPVNAKVTAATGITKTRCEANWYGWLALNIKWTFDESGARAISPVLMARTEGIRRNGRVIGRYLIPVYKLDRTPKYGMTEAEMMASVGITHPSTTPSENRRLPIAGRLSTRDDLPANEDPHPDTFDSPGKPIA
jgi:hypothetical protein